MKQVFSIVIVIAVCGVIFHTLGESLDKNIATQDTMLCESAQNSQNEAYMQKCECYYISGDITCLRGK